MSNKFSNYKIYAQLANKVHKNYKKIYKFKFISCINSLQQ